MYMFDFMYYLKYEGFMFIDIFMPHGKSTTRFFFVKIIEDDELKELKEDLTNS